MPASASKKSWRILLGCLRGIRVGVLLVVLLLATLVLYFNEVGLPDFLKKPLVEQLRSRGIDLQFTRLRWRSYRGFVADNVRFGPAKPEANAPEFAIREVELKINHRALLGMKLQVERLVLHDGKVVWPVLDPGRPPLFLTVTNLQTQLRFLTNDQWELDNFSANFAGARLHLAGSLTNASAVRDWKVFHGHAEAQPESLRRHLRGLATALERIKFVKPPELNIIVHGNAREAQSLNGLVTLEATGADTPWGTLTNGLLIVRLIPPDGSNDLSKAEFRLRAEDVATPWGNTGQFQLDLHAAGDDKLTNLVQAQLEVYAGNIVTPWAQAGQANFSAHWTHSLTNPVPTAGTGRLQASNVRLRWGSVSEVNLDASLSTPPTNSMTPANASWGWWAALQPYFLDWNCTLKKIRAEDFESPELVCAGKWRAPELSITNLQTKMYGGQFNADTILNVATREVRFECASDFDVLKATPFLTPGGRAWFEHQQFAWEKPPQAHAIGNITLPAWTNHHPDWHGEVLPTFFLQGDFKVGAASYHGVPVTSAQSHFTYSDMTWDLPDLFATRPEGSVRISHKSNDRTKDYYFQVHSTMDVHSVEPALEPKARKVLDSFIFTQPPLIDAELWGRWHEYSRIGFKAQVTASNFVFRGEAAAAFHGKIDYTNEFLLLTDGRLDRTNKEYITATSLGVDINGKKAYVTNGFSTMEPMSLLHTIGPKVSQTLEPYHFTLPPTVSANGVIPLSDDISVADLHFKVDGGTFEWLKFRLPHVSSMIIWTGERMTINDAQAVFYQGVLTGTAAFDFHRKLGTDFHFDTIITGTSLHALVEGLTSGTNQLEGTLNGHLSITQANSQDPLSWFGKGNVNLQDGKIWDIPIFGILSPVLDTISPGLGKSRASEASANFIITNSIIRSDDLDIRSPTIRLLYRGTVDFKMQVDAVVEAQVGHDTPLVGPLVSTVFSPFSKLFETKVTGTLSNPRHEPVMFVTKLLTPFLHPFHTLKDIFIGDGATGTNAPVWPEAQPNNQH